MARLSNQIMKENLEGFPGYHVTKTGNIFSNRSGKWVKLCTGLNPYGYVQVHLNKKTYRVNRLVALVYIPNPENKPFVCHRDNNRLNNKVENLYWGTAKENTQQSISEGRFRPRGKKIKTKKEIKAIRKDWIDGIPTSKICKKHDIGKTSLRKYTFGLDKRTGDVAKLTVNQIMALKKDYDSGQYTLKTLGQKYGIGRTSARKYYVTSK